jgi:hypothetical protein
LFPALPDYHLRFELLNRPHQLRFTEDFASATIGLPKFTRSVTELASPLDQWTYFLRHAAALDPAASLAFLTRPERMQGFRLQR